MRLYNWYCNLNIQVCAQAGTVFDPTLDRCEFCELVYPCNADPNNIRCATSFTSESPKPTCPPFDPNVYICVCGALTCNLELITTTTTPKPTCPPYDPNVYICVCSDISCALQMITTTTPICPPYDPSVYTCVCSATSCELILITTTSRPVPTCPPYDPNVYICVCGSSTCNLELITTTAPTRLCPGTTRKTTVSNFVYDCSGKPDGDYQDPFDPCSGYFWTCTNGEPFYEVILI
jgi:hypothetical protein